MPRSSEITRSGLGDRVIGLAAKGDTAPVIATTLSAESGKHFSPAMVNRYLQKQSLNAGPTEEHRALELLVAAIAGAPDTRDSAQSSYYGLYKLDTTNIFTTYSGIARGIKNGQVMRGFKNLALKITNGASLVGDEKDTEKLAAVMKNITFAHLLQNVVRSTCEMGTCVVELHANTGELITPQVLPMSYITLLTDSETAGSVSEGLVKGEVTQVVFNEGDDGEINYGRDDVALFRIWADDTELTDIQGRSTYGIYGESMTLGIETPLKSQMNAAFNFDAFMNRYGSGRLLHNFTLLADMLKEKQITVAAAQKTIENDAAAGQKIAANEDIYGTGKEVSMLESKTGFDIVPYLEWRGKQIDRALLQSDVGSGDVGSSWTSAGTAVSAQELVTLQSLRDTFFATFFSEIVTPHLEAEGVDPATVSLVAEPLSQVPVPYQVLSDWAERGHITEAELRVRGGFSREKPDET